MSEDRSMHTDALAVLGNVITDKDNVGRDAIHLAVEPVIAGEKLEPGEEIGFRKDKDYGVAYAMGSGLGIVDPFIQRHVQEGEKFFMVLHPRTITSLRHVWEHPSFNPKEYTSEAEARLREFATEIDVSFSRLMAGAADYLETDDNISDGGKFEGVSVYRGFWKDYQTLTGKQPIKAPGTYNEGQNLIDMAVTNDYDDDFFSCSC